MRVINNSAKIHIHSAMHCCLATYLPWERILKRLYPAHTRGTVKSKLEVYLARWCIIAWRMPSIPMRAVFGHSRLLECCCLSFPLLYLKSGDKLER